jgi:site-specific recombinase XerD
MTILARCRLRSRRGARLGHIDKWTLSLADERHLAQPTIRGYQTDLRLFSEYLTDRR